MDVPPSTFGSQNYYEIYTGTWTDWSRGRILGGTLTTTSTHGGLLIAFLSLYVTVAGTCFWRIGCFIFHYVYSTEAARDAFYHQRQAVLRNAANATTGITTLFQMVIAWRRTQPSKQSSLRLLPLLAFTLVTLAVFAAASTFSSRISNTGAVLIAGNNCGLLGNFDSLNMTDYMHIYETYMSRRMTSDANYAQQCYANVPSTDGCRTFFQSRLPARVVRNATCPFSAGICKSQDSNILLDSGYLDSDSDFGSNSPKDHRFQFRILMQCAPLATEGYQKQVPRLAPDLHDPYMRYYYGENRLSGLPNSDFTYQHMVLQKDQFVLEDNTGALSDFDLKGYRAISFNGSLDEDYTMFTPIKELARMDADVYLLFLSTNAVFFSYQSDDLWYPAHDLGGNMTDTSIENGSNSIPLYFGDEPASPLGCVRQYQFCSGPGGGTRGGGADSHCTPLSSFLDAYSVAYTRWAQDEPYWDTLNWTSWAVRGTQDPLFGSIESMGSAVLESSSRKVAGIMGPLSRDQWQLDVEKWYNISLASIQQNFVEIAAGPADGRLRDWAIKPANDGQKRFCNNQKVRNTTYTNFSVFGLAMLLGIGFLIIVVSYTLEPFAIWIQHRRNLDTYARLEWTMNETLQLQRLAHEELGLGSWHRCDTDVPVTERLERLGVMDLSEKTHPRLKAPPVSLEEAVNQNDKEEDQNDKTEVRVGDLQEVPSKGNSV